MSETSPSFLVPSPRMTAAFPALSRLADTVTEPTEPAIIDIVFLNKFIGVSAMSALPHVDDGWAWSVLWVMRANGHEFGTADHKARGDGVMKRKPLKSPGLVRFAVNPGQLFLTNLHRTHWLDHAKDHSLFVALFWDFKERPLEADVIARIEASIAEFGVPNG